ncbi:MAG: DinB family protein [Cyclobacteriaceae bacterium]
MKKLNLLLFLPAFFLMNLITAQSITPKDVVASWDLMASMVVESAKLMPREYYSFTPGDPLRNFANQLNHTTASNIGFAASVKAGAPDFDIPDRKNPPQDKEAVIAILEKSFSYFKSGLEKLTQSDLEEIVSWGHPSNPKKITRLKAILIVTSHLQREHGKTMMYLRAKGITPAPSKSWSF